MNDDYIHLIKHQLFEYKNICSKCCALTNISLLNLQDQLRMAEAAVTQPEVTPEVVVTQPEVTPKVDNTSKEDVSMDVEISSDTSNTKTNNSDKKEYSEEEKQKRREYFKKLKNSRKLARDKYNKNILKRLGIPPMLNSSFKKRGEIQLTKTILSRNMSDDEKKMLDFYKVRLSTLRSENESLHKRLAYLVNENMRFLQVFEYI